jgi:hypothetical protein
MKLFAALALTVFTLLAAGASAQVPPPPPPPPPPSMPAPPRDLPFAPPTGGASISGRVVTADERPTPIRAVIVTLRGDGFRTGWTFVTDATGTFSFANLPPGRFVLAASRVGFPSINYGAPRPGRPGASIVLKDNERLADLSIALPRGAVITGRVTDDNGAPVVGSRISAGTIVLRNGERTMAYGGNGFTDDRGEYRIFGLAAGDYAVWVEGRSLGTSGGIRYTPAEIDSVLNRGVGVSRPGQAPPPPPEGQEMAPTSIYFPSATSLLDAAPVHVDAGETRAGIDIRAAYLPAVSLSGTLLDPDGKPPAGVVMNLVRIGAARGPAIFGHPSPKDGTFRFTGITPGHYAITARATPQGDTAAAGDTAPLWARADIDINGIPMSGVNIRLQPGTVVRGGVSFDIGPQATPPATIRMALTAVAAPGDISMGVGDAPVRNGAFEFTGVIPGRYRVNAQLPGLTTSLWTIKSATINGQDALDAPFDVGSTDLDGLTITLTNKITGVTGTLEDASGRAAPDYYVIVFPEDPAFWFQGSRRIKAVRPTAQGGYLVRGLPPGAYRIGAVTDVETNEWFEPSFLQQLLPASAALTLVEGEMRAFPLKIGG